MKLTFYMILIYLQNIIHIIILYTLNTIYLIAPDYLVIVLLAFYLWNLHLMSGQSSLKGPINPSFKFTHLPLPPFSQTVSCLERLKSIICK